MKLNFTRQKKIAIVVALLITILVEFAPLNTIYAQSPAGPPAQPAPQAAPVAPAQPPAPAGPVAPGPIGPPGSPGAPPPGPPGPPGPPPPPAIPNAGIEPTPEENNFGFGKIYEDCEFWQFFCKGRNLVRWTLIQITYGVGYLTSVLARLGANLLNTSITFNQNLLKNNSFVATGFKNTLDLANLGFILVLIIIAFATILRVQTYGLKRLLTNLIIAAVLINFSLAIAGIFFDFSNVLSDFFLGRSGGKEEIGSNIANMMSIQTLLNAAGKSPPVSQDVPQPAGNNLNSVHSNFLKYFVSLTFVVIFTLLASIIFIALAFMVFVRGIYLTFLLILMPLAWLFWTFPTLTYLWNKWWSKFLQWIFFLPAATFFIYLSLVTFTAENSITTGVSAGTGEFYALIVKLILSLFMLMAALLTARSMGITGANVAMRGVGTLKNMAIGATKRAGFGAARGAARGAAGAAKYFGGEKAARGTARVASKLLSTRGIRAIPGAKGLANRLAGLGSRKEDVESYQKDVYSNRTDEDLKKMARRPLPLGDKERSAFLKELSERNKIGDVTEDMDPDKKSEFLTALATATKKTNPGTKAGDIKAIKDIITAAPSLAAELTGKKNPDGSWTNDKGESTVKFTDQNGVEQTRPMTKKDIITEFTPKINASEAHKLAKTELQNIDVVNNLTPAAVTNIYRQGSDEKIGVLRKTLNDVLPQNLRGVAKKIAEMRQVIREAKEANNPKLNDFQNTLNGLQNSKANQLATATDEQKTAFRRLEFVEQKIGAEPFEF